MNHGYRASCHYADSRNYLIPGEKRQRIGRKAIETVVDECAEKCDLQDEIYTDANGTPRKRVTPYSFRAGYITHMKDKVAPEELQYLAGHKKIETTLKYYTNVTDDDIDRMQNHTPDI